MKQRLIMEALANNGKPAFIIARSLVNAEPHVRLRRIHETKRFISDAMRYRTRIAIVSMAQSKEELLSAMQMVELAAFTGLQREQAKEAVNLIGRYYDKEDKE